jgi:hypothetical protein
VHFIVVTQTLAQRTNAGMPGSTAKRSSDDFRRKYLFTYPLLIASDYTSPPAQRNGCHFV